MDIPIEWKVALSHVQVLYPSAIIGGGCLRDLDNGREIKDIDIFVRGGTAVQLSQLHSDLSAGPFDCEDIYNSKMYPVGEVNDLVGFFEARFPELDYPLQIIMVDFEGDDLLDRFDFGICRISYDGETVTRSPDYVADKANEVFRLCLDRAPVALVASIHRFARLSRKYDGWRFQLQHGSGDDELFDAMFS